MPIQARRPIANALVLACAFCSACSGQSTRSPVAPTPVSVAITLPVATPTVPTTVVLSGRVTSTNGGQPLGGVTVSVPGFSPLKTDAAGNFSIQLPNQIATYKVSVVGDQIVPRVINVAVSATRTVSPDAITLGGGYDASFYQDFVRDAYEGPGDRPLRRWTRSPNIYLKTVDESGKPIDANTLATVESILSASTPILTAGKLSIASFERGMGTREGQSGWITVKFPTASASCGRAQIAAEGGWIELYAGALADGYTCRVCPSNSTIDKATIRHELGHALGFYHTRNRDDLMFAGGSWSACDQPFSSRELLHAAIAYSRPVGNIAPDTDPSSVLAQQVSGAAEAPIVSCRP